MFAPGDGTPRTGSTVDSRFGAVRWECTPRSVRVCGEALPDVTVARTGSAVALAWIPIGTRRAADLSLTVAGHPAGLTPGKGGLSRRSYRVAVEIDSGRLLLAPNSPTSSRLVRGTSSRGGNELGTVARTADARARVEWSEPVNVLGLEVDVLTPTPTEAAVGYALALAFGTGAQFLAPALLTAAARLLPG